MTDSSSIIIVKRDSSSENFSYDKLITSILKAGVPTDAANKLSKIIEKWVVENQKNGQLNSTELRDKVIEVLNHDFSSEADSYQAFVK